MMRLMEVILVSLVTCCACRGLWCLTYIANRLAATLARWMIHRVPTSITRECAIALGEIRQNGCLAAVKVITSPEATIQALTIKRKKFFDSVCRHAGDVMKLLPEGFVNLHAVMLHRQRYTSVEEP